MAPLTLRNAPNRINTTIAVEAVDRVMPKIPSLVINSRYSRRSNEKPPWPKMPIKYWPNRA
ncbi:hypothetical protein D3C85_1698940 [compost metagenome]